MSNHERLPLSAVALLKRDKTGVNEIDLQNYTSVENLLADKAGRIQPAKMPNSGRLDSYDIDDILVGNIRPYLKKIWHSDHAGGTNGDVLVFQARKDVENPILPRYLYHILASDQYFQYLQDHRKEGKMPRGDRNQALNFEILLPLPEVQKQIITILDTFTALDASMNRELELRETQIEVCLGDIFASDEIANSHSVPLGHLLRHIQPGKYQVNSTEYDPSAPTPVLSPGKAFLLGYTDETDGIFEASPDDPAIIFDDFTTNFHWVDFPFKVKSSAMKMLVPRSDDFVFRYAYWAMKTIPYKPTEHQRQWLQTYSRFEIPLPPLDVQERIVDTLDMFTDYTDNLRREIDLRRQQLEYYRGQLLTFPVAE